MATADISNFNKDFTVFGQNLRNYRKGLGWTTQEMANRCKIGRATLMRIFSGAPCSPITQNKIAQNLNIRLDSLWLEDLATPRRWFHHIEEKERWSFSDPIQASKWALNEQPGLLDPDSIQDPHERLRLGTTGQGAAFVKMHRSHLPNGFHGYSFDEAYDRVNLRIPHHVAAICLVLIRGALRVFLDEEIVVLQEGETLIIDSSVACAYEPLKPVTAQNPPPRHYTIALNVSSPKKNKRKTVRELA